MNMRIRVMSAWAGPIFLVLYVIAFGPIAGYLPPHPPSLSLADVAIFYQTHAETIRAGQLLGLISSALLFPWFALISTQIARIEGRFPILALCQFGGGVLLIVFFQICGMMWVIAAWRPDLDPNIIRVFHEGSWLIFVMVYPCYTLQLTCIALAGFIDKSPEPIFPRWVCYLNLWVGFSAIGGGFAEFFKSGPFAWNGLFGFYVPVLSFVAWIFVMTRFLLKGIRLQSSEG